MTGVVIKPGLVKRKDRKEVSRSRSYPVRKNKKVKSKEYRLLTRVYIRIEIVHRPWSLTK
jgi:hypothetical protein